MTTPTALENEHTLRSATARFDRLRGKDEVTLGEALERLALSEVIVRKAAYGRQLDIRAAREAGASWSQIGAALGTSKQAAWESHNRWIDGQAAAHQSTGISGMDDDTAAAARAAAGSPDS
jgi:hypothetical protein